MTDLQNTLNTYGKKIVSLIYKEYKNSLGNKELSFFNLSQNNFIIVSPPKNTQEPLFELKEDGYLYVYPYQKEFKDKTEEQILSILLSSLTHEIFRYLITSKNERKLSVIEEHFTKFLIEGLLEYYSLSLSQKYNLPVLENEFQVNLDFAKHLLKNIPEEMDKDKFAFHYDISLMCEAYQIKTKKSLIEKYEKEYLKENDYELLTKFLTKYFKYEKEDLQNDKLTLLKKYKTVGTYRYVEENLKKYLLETYKNNAEILANSIEELENLFHGKEGSSKGKEEIYVLDLQYKNGYLKSICLIIICLLCGIFFAYLLIR